MKIINPLLSNHAGMNSRFLLLLVLLFLLTPLTGQKTNKVAVETVSLHYPTHVIPDLDEISVKILPGNISMDEALYFLDHTTDENRLRLGASAQFSNNIDELYFQFPGYQLVDSSTFQIEVIFNQLNINKNLQSSSYSVDEFDLSEIYSYKLTGSFPCSLKISVNGNLIFEEAIFSEENNFSVTYIGSKEVFYESSSDIKSRVNQSEYFQSEGELLSSYERNRDAIYSIIERAELISALMKARKMVETCCFFAYYPQTLEIAAPSGKKINSTELITAQFNAIEAFKEFAIDHNKNAFQSSISTAAEIWKKEVLNFETDRAGSGLNNKAVVLLYNNLALFELYVDNIQAAEDWLFKAMKLKKSNSAIQTTQELLRKRKILEQEKINFHAIKEKIIPVNEALGYKATPDVATAGNFIYSQIAGN